MTNDYDVIIIGGGGAGLSAAQQALENGASVLIVDAGDRLGGSTNLSGGHVYAAGTSVQRAAGIMNDTSEDAFRYYMALNQYKPDAGLVRTYCEEASQVVEWLIGLGVEFPAADLHAGGVDPTRREHFPVGNGAAIVAALEGAIDGRADVALQTRVCDLIVEDGRVAGIRVDGTEVRAAAVIISSGGFGANPALLARHYPDALHGDYTWYIGSDNAQGDHFMLGEQAGAEVTGFNRGLLLTTPGLRKELEIGVPSSLVCVNHEGRRFASETLSYNVMAGVLGAQTGSECFAIFDEDARASAQPDPHVQARVKAGTMITCWTPDQLDEFIAKGRILYADTLADLARKADIRWPALQTTVDDYNLDCDAGVDTRFRKQASVWKAVRRGPFYAARIKPAVVCFTSTGLRIDEKARVRGVDDRPIAGLFAAGEAAGGVLGEHIFGGGSSMAHILSFGRIAGRNAAQVARAEAINR